jgi:hypothetical protein
LTNHYRKTVIQTFKFKKSPVGVLLKFGVNAL